MAKKSILTAKSLKFLENYINNPAPTGFESAGQKMWLEYVKPYVDEYFVDTYGSVAAIVNPKAEYKVVRHMPMKFLGLYIILMKKALFICVEMVVLITK